MTSRIQTSSSSMSFVKFHQEWMGIFICGFLIGFGFNYFVVSKLFVLELGSVHTKSSKAVTTTAIDTSSIIRATSTISTSRKEMLNNPLAGTFNATNNNETTTTTINTTTTKTAFEQITDIAYQDILDDLWNITTTSLNNQSQQQRKRQFKLQEWKNRTGGGLRNPDRRLLAKIYTNAESVFEFGLGESTLIANYVGVTRYVGVDSDPVWVTMARDKVQDSSPHYRFSLADIGPTKEWGYPIVGTTTTLAKQIYNYQIVPLLVEPQPFDVYMVDGRYRFPCVLTSFLHASARGANPEKTIVLLHDCRQGFWEQIFKESDPWRRRHYQLANTKKLFTLVHSGSKLCLFQRRPETTDEQLMELWFKYKASIG